MRNRKIKLLIIIIVVLSIFSMSLYYSKFIIGGNISGSVVVPPKNLDGIIITSIDYLESNNVNIDSSEILDKEDTTVESRIVLNNDINSSITYKVTIKNYDIYAVKYEGYSIINSDNEEIEIVVDGINIGDELKSGETVEFNITYKYKDNIIDITNNELYSIVTYNFGSNDYNYEDDYEEFEGNNFVDTGIKLFSQENANKDFEVSFVLESLGNGQNGQAVLFGDMNENGEPYPGILVRYSNGISLVANVSANNRHDNNIKLEVGSKLILRRIKGMLSYSVDGGNTFTNYADFTNFTSYFDVNATFGGGLNNNLQPFRYFKGTLTDMNIVLLEPKNYTVRFNSNGGTGNMNNQIFNVNLAGKLSANTFVKDDYVFNGWNTKEDGTGKSYEDKEEVSKLGSEDEIIDLYAQWIPYPEYTVVFDSNGGTGTMNNQLFTYGTPQNLYASTFTKNGYTFMNWNTKSDGTGRTYKDQESVLNLTNKQDGIVTLYAMYGVDSYHSSNQVVFDGGTYINTNVYLFNNDNLHRNFEISFRIANLGNNANLSTIINAMYEVQPWPGLVFRTNNNNLMLNGNFGNVAFNQGYPNSNKDITIRRINDKLYFSTDKENFEFIADISDVTAINVPVTIGASLNNEGNPWRYFTGTLEDVNIYVY